MRPAYIYSEADAERMSRENSLAKCRRNVRVVRWQQGVAHAKGWPDNSYENLAAMERLWTQAAILRFDREEARKGK